MSMGSTMIGVRRMLNKATVVKTLLHAQRRQGMGYILDPLMRCVVLAMLQVLFDLSILQMRVYPISKRLLLIATIQQQLYLAVRGSSATTLYMMKVAIVLTTPALSVIAVLAPFR